MLFSYEIFTQDFYRIISYRIESYKSNGFYRKKFKGSQSHIFFWKSYKSKKPLKVEL
jgi:hypothetical protein